MAERRLISLNQLLDEAVMYVALSERARREKLARVAKDISPQFANIIQAFWHGWFRGLPDFVTQKKAAENQQNAFSSI